MMHESGSPAWSIEAGDDGKWFDGWRIVTGVLTVLFLAGGVWAFSQVDADKESSEAYRKCQALEADANARAFNSGYTYDYACNDEWSEVLTIFGLYLLAVATCFGLATLADQGSGFRRVFTVIGGLAAFPPALIPLVAIALMTFLLGRVIGLVRRMVP